MSRTPALPEWPPHGGWGAPLLARFGLEDRPVIDFSANINPLGAPAWLAERLQRACAGLERYPDPGYGGACRAIAAAMGLDSERVLLTNGGVEAIYLAAALHAGRRAAIVQPTFGEYARACRHYRVAVCDVVLAPPDFALDEARVTGVLGEVEALFLCRPNNPSATLIPRAAIERLAARAEACGVMLVVDEAFVDFTASDEALTPLLERYANLVLLRSMTKLYAVPGLRLGYLLGSRETVRRARALQMPWSVNRLAAELAAPLLDDRDFAARTRHWLAEERTRLGRALAALDIEAPPSWANFHLLRDRRRPRASGALFEFLLRRGILARHTQNFVGLEGGWLRLAIRSGEENARLLEALAAWRAAT